MKRLFTLFIVLFSLGFTSYAVQPMGSWHTHQAFNYTTEVSLGEDKVYALSEGALYSVGKQDSQIEIYSKISGLNDNNITHIAYNYANQSLLITYENSNIDLIDAQGAIFNISDIYLNNLSGGKSINAIYMSGNYAYLSCQYGISVINVAKKEIGETYLIGENGSTVSVIGTCIADQEIYAITTDKIYHAPLSGTNLLNYQNWDTLAVSFPAGFKEIYGYNNKLYVLTDDNKVSIYNKLSWQKNVYASVNHLSTDHDRLFVSYTDSIAMLYGSTHTTYTARWSETCVLDTTTNTMWCNDTYGVYKAKTTTDIQRFKPQGPLTNSPYRMRFFNGYLYVVAGARWATQSNISASVMIYDGNTWTNISESQIKAVVNNPSQETHVYDFVDIAAEEGNPGHFYCASYGHGLFEFENFLPVKQYNNDNSSVLSYFPDLKDSKPYTYYYYTRVDALQFDASGNLWMFNPSPNYPFIKYMKPDHTVVSATPASQPKFETIDQIFWDNTNANRHYMLVHRYTGSLNSAFYAEEDVNNTPNYFDDDLQATYSQFTDQDGKVFTPENFLCAAQDLTDNIWIGTTEGIAVLENVDQIFSSDFTCTRIIIPRNDGTGLGDYLLGEETVTAIAIDGANRKWIGTNSSGLYLVSADGKQTIHHFTESNSPLLANHITSIAINQETGEVFIGTSIGIISYQSDAIEANSAFTEIHAYPNPVRASYSGLITITGLVTETLVRITDINGNVIYTTQSNGGIATWDGTNINGHRVASGVYMAQCYTTDGTMNATTKILILSH